MTALLPLLMAWGVTIPPAVAATDPRTAASSTGATTPTTTTVPPTSTTTVPPTTTTAPQGHEAQPADGGRTRRAVTPRMPSDSELAALADLAAIRLELIGLEAEIARLEALRAADRATLRRLRSERAATLRRRASRAVAAYRAQSTGWRVQGRIPESLDRARAILLLERTDTVERRRLRSLDERIERLRTRLAAQVRLRDGSLAHREALRAREQALVAKLASAGGGLQLVAPGGPVTPGPDRVAQEAAAALAMLVRADRDRPPSEPAWSEALRRLADAVVASPRVPARTPPGPLADAVRAAPLPVQRVVLFALSQVGKPYVYATAGPETYDCSGLTKRAWQEAGLGLPHFSGAQLRLGVAIRPEELRPGDLLAYGPDGSEHVTLAIGAGLVVEGRGRAAGVIVAPARTDPSRDGFAGAVRLLP